MVDLYGGHLIPGTFFFLLGIRWLLVTSYLHAKAELARRNNRNVSKKQKKREEKSNNKKSSKQQQQPRHHAECYYYTSTPTMPAACLPCPQIRAAWTESYLKLVGAIIGLVFHIREGLIAYNTAIEHPELATDDTWALIYRVKHHVIMYMAFFLGSIVELLVHCGTYKLPRRLDRAMLIMEFGVEAFVFSNHFHGRINIDVQLHILLAFTIISCLMFSILEAYNDKQVFYTYGRILFTFLQASWFYQVAFTLYHPKYRWDVNDVRLTANVTFHYAIHFFIVVVLILVCHSVTLCLVESSNVSWLSRSKRKRVKTERFYGIKYEVCDGSTTDEDLVVASRGVDAANPSVLFDQEDDGGRFGAN